ncbi:MAG: DUF1722 domain-containing protein [Deltaproteobacteria bacterium]|jgi:hypothetical protein|nr:DUF1722 domain-containing protein [Deltaproteobacteria bacterium]
MRIWDLNPGYLNNQSLLGEHAELHGLISVLKKQSGGYSNHPETKRWVGHAGALQKRHQFIAAEMKLRGMNEKSPVNVESGTDWPDVFVDEPFEQIQILKKKYSEKKPGRIPLPDNVQQLWSQHKYSVMARNTEFYREVGKKAAANSSWEFFQEMALELSQILRVRPQKGGIYNSLLHMWGYVSDLGEKFKGDVNKLSLEELLREVRTRAFEFDEQYLLHSTALGEFGAWLEG